MRAFRFLPHIMNRHISGLPNGNLFKSFNRQHKMLIRRITFSTTIRSEPIIWSTKICDRNNNRSPRNTPPQIINTLNLKTRATDLSTFKH
ncbi:hypothetical protein OIU78_000582 [Salix suchowensis]|nr:hypothetical protein OIU78_000582 [Salix suchowensis]